MRKKEKIESGMVPPIEKNSALENIKFQYDLLSYVEKLKTCPDVPFIGKYKPPANVQDFIIKSFQSWVSGLEGTTKTAKNPEVPQVAQAPSQFSQMELQFLKQFISKAISKNAPRVQPVYNDQIQINNSNNPPPIL